ncbi:MAG: hypothetical protein KZQ83_19415 [gamma proteobacterium symbiont of Taylorina sp.]|nr:hypothetical protein [gamma proteobacterium symbiont of Taylorina sp.]
MTVNKKLMDSSARQFLAIASVQSELFAVKHISKRISLSAKNAKAIAARAGSQAMGFHPITDFIDDVAINITHLVEKINAEALRLSSYAIANRNRSRTIEKMTLASNDMLKYADHKGIKIRLEELKKKKKQFLIEYGRKNSDLLELLAEIRNQLQAAEMICTTSRTEATRAGDFQSNLEVVADEVFLAVSNIKETLQSSKNHLSQLSLR